MNTQNKLNAIIEAINSMDASELIQLNRDFCESCNYSGSEIFDNDEDFFNNYFEGKPFEVARATFYGDYNFSHDYVIFNGYGNLESFNAYKLIDNLAESVEGIAADIIENINDYEFDFTSVIEDIDEDNE